MIRPMTNRPVLRAAVAALLSVPILLSAPQAQVASPPQASGRDMIDRIFLDREFTSRALPQPEWLEGGASYALVEPAAEGRGSNVVRYDTATGAKRDVLISAAQLTPPGGAAPLDFDAISWSNDGRRALVFTNTQRVWRTNARGDYWLFDRTTGTLKRIGGSAGDASLMYATF